MTKKEIAMVGQKLYFLLEGMKIYFEGAKHSQSTGCGYAGCFGAKLDIFIHGVLRSSSHLKGGYALVSYLGFKGWGEMVSYTEEYWPTTYMEDAFSGGYGAYVGYSRGWPGVCACWQDFAINMINGEKRCLKK